MYYYDIAPLVKISQRKKEYFTYESLVQASQGDLVSIFFGPRKIKGVILKSSSKPKFYKTKPILEIIEKKIISQNQLSLAKKISQYYFASLGVCLKLFIPKKNVKSGMIIKNEREIKQPKIILTPEQKKVAEEIAKNYKKEFLLQGPASSGKTEIIMEIIKKISPKKQILIIIPEIFLSYQEIDRYKRKFPNRETLLLHSQLKPSLFHQNWKKIKNGQAQIIIATKIGLFCDFKKLELIVIDEEQDLSHKQWGQFPHYHSKNVAHWLADIHQAKSIYVSATPSMETIDKFKNNKKNVFSLPMLKKGKIKVLFPKIIFEDLKKYYRKKNDCLISPELVKNLKKTLENKKMTFILSPQRGKSRFIICKNCSKTIVCPNCGIRLIEIGDYYRCIHCNYKISNINACPYCRSLSLENIGFGTEKIFSEIQKKIPTAKIEMIDQSFFRVANQRENLYKKIKNQKVDILIGTQTIIKGFDFPHLQLAVILNAEHFNENGGDFRSNERYLGNLFQLAGRLNRPGGDNKGILFIQTFNPSDPLFNYLKKWDWNIFAEQELKKRKELKYPPFSLLIKLIYRNTEKTLVEKNTQLTYNKISNILKQEREDVQIFSPYFGFIGKRNNVWEKNLLIKTIPKKLSHIKEITDKLDNNWEIDINPENIF